MIGRIPEDIRRIGSRARALAHSLWGRWAVLALGGLISLAALHEHDVHVRQFTELREVKSQTAKQVAALRAQAEAAMREANEHAAQRIRELETQQRRLAESAEQLRGRLAALHAEERAKVEQVATLPTSEVATRVAARLGLASDELASPQAGAGGAAPKGLVPALRSGVYKLSDSGLRKVEASLVELDSCREQASVLSEQVATCNEQAATQSEIAKSRAEAIEKLNEALAAKDQILARTETEHRAELEAIRGTRLSRWTRTLEHVAVGVLVGVALR